jgi:hypothetical protein
METDLPTAINIKRIGWPPKVFYQSPLSLLPTAGRPPPLFILPRFTAQAPLDVHDLHHGVPEQSPTVVGPRLQ